MALTLPGQPSTAVPSATGSVQATPLASSAAESTQNGNLNSSNAAPSTSVLPPAKTDVPAATTSANDNRTATNVGDLMDAVGAAGFDLGAEEESLRAAAAKPANSGEAAVDRTRKQDFIETGILAECVKRIAAAFQLNFLEPDTIPFIALATRTRLGNLIEQAIAARDHRQNSSHLRPPPFIPNKRKRINSHDSDASSSTDSDEEEEENSDGMELGDESSSKKKKKRKSGTAAWDSVVYDDAEKWLHALEKVDREEERKKRRERMLRDQKEQQEKDLAEQIAQSEQTQREIESEQRAGAGNLAERLLTGTPQPSTPGSTTGKEEGTTKKPVTKKKPLGATTLAKNMSEDVKKRLTDQVAMRSLGGKNFSWLNPGASRTNSPGGFGTPTPASALPKPKFASGSSLPAPNFGASSSAGGIPSAVSRLSNVPPLHDVSREQRALEEWQQGMHIVELNDMLFALERERGLGAGKGSGKPIAVRVRAGIIKR